MTQTYKNNNKQQIITLSQQFISNLDTQHKCIIENAAQSQEQKILTFTRIENNNDGDNLNQGKMFEVYVSSNKMKYQDNSFTWYCNRNIPQIKIKANGDSQNHIKLNKKRQHHKNEMYTFYINGCFIDRNKLACTNLKGESLKQDKSQCSFNSLRFLKTSHTLNPSKSAIFQPFLPATLKRIKVVQQVTNSLQRKQQADNNSSYCITIRDSIQGLSDYFKGSIIKQKVCHPLFLAMNFSNTVNLYFQKDMLPTSQASKEDNLKVKDFLKNIYSEYVELVINQDNQFIKKNDYILFKLENLNEIQLAYKLAFTQLELMLLSSQNNELQKNQQINYKQDPFPIKDKNFDDLFFIPGVQITLNRQLVNQNMFTKVPVQNLGTQDHYINESTLNQQNKFQIISSCSQRILKRPTDQLNSVNISNIKQADFKYILCQKKKIKKYFQNDELQQQIFINQEKSIDSKNYINSEIQNNKEMLQDQEKQIKFKNQDQQISNIQQNKYNEIENICIFTLNKPQQKNSQTQSSQYKGQLKQKNKQNNFSDKYKQIVSHNEEFNNKNIIATYTYLKKKEIKTNYKVNYNYNQKLNNIKSPKKQLEDIQIQEQELKQKNEQQNCQQQQTKLYESNLDCLNLEFPNLSITTNPNINNSNYLYQQTKNFQSSSTQINQTPITESNFYSDSNIADYSIQNNNIQNIL